jgi:hypothetical protein
MQLQVWSLIRHYKESTFECNTPGALTNEDSYMNARTGKKLRVAKVDRKTYTRERQAELDGTGYKSAQKTHKRYGIRLGQGLNAVYNGKNITFSENNIMLGWITGVTRGPRSVP